MKACNKIIFKIYNKSFSNLINFTNQKTIVDSLKEPEEYRTFYIENLPIQWSEDEIKVRLEQISKIEKLNLIKNSVGESTGKSNNLIYSSYCYF